MTQLSPVIRVAAEEWVPYTTLLHHNGTLDVKGPMKYFLDEFSRVLGASYEILRPSDGMWGIMLPNGSYNGMVGMLLREEADFALGPFFIGESREKVADFTATFYYDSYYIVSQRPVASSDPTGIIKTFQPQVWLLVAVCMAVVGVVMMGMIWLTERLQGSGGTSRVSWAAMWSVQGLFQEPTSWLPGNASGRLMVTVWVLSALVIASVYRGNITAMLTLPKIEVPIDSINDLTNQNRLPWKLEHGGLENFLLKSKDKAMQKMGAEFSGFIPSCWSARHEIQTGEFATACDKTSTMTMMAWDFRWALLSHPYHK
ncbi:glutamate receptor-like [Scylla paramamosain]|uniref:glutamate receptor-like n=1 Tax=Scylla paramamosain TaxID=85552 RepID=UPI003083079B